MNGNKFLIDTNIALYLLNGNEVIAGLLDGNVIYVSFITQLELFSFKSITKTEIENIKSFLKDCIVFDLNEEIKQKTIEIRQNCGIKLPDAIIAATSVILDIPLVTADKGFAKIEELNLVLFEV